MNKSILALVSMAVVLSTVQARASTPEDRALAETLFQEGRKLMKEGKPAEACPKFEASQKLDPAPGTLLNLGTCHAAIGKTATAWVELTESVARAKKDGRDDRLQIAQDELAKIEPKLSKLTVVLDAKNVAAGIDVKLDGKPLESGAWGVELPVDPGSHSLAVSAPGKKSWSTTIAIGAGADRKRVEIPPLADSDFSEGAVDATEPSDGGSRRTWGYVVGGIGIVAAGVGTYFAIHAHSLRGDADSLAAAGDPAALDKASDARTAITVARVGLGAGIVALGASAYLLLTAPTAEHHSIDSSAFRVVPDVGASWAGVSLSGGW